MGAGVGAGAGFFWQTGLVVGLQVGKALRCSSYFGLRSASICDEGIKLILLHSFTDFLPWNHL